MAIVQSALAAFAESYQKAWEGQVALAEKQRLADFRDAQLVEQQRQFNQNDSRQGAQFDQTHILNTTNSLVRNAGVTQATQIAAEDQATKNRYRGYQEAAVGKLPGGAQGFYDRQAEDVNAARGSERGTAQMNEVIRIASAGDINAANVRAREYGLGVTVGSVNGALTWFGSDGRAVGTLTTPAGIRPLSSAETSIAPQEFGPPPPRGFQYSPVSGASPIDGSRLYGGRDGAPGGVLPTDPYAPDYSAPPLQGGAYLDSLRRQGADLEYMMSLDDKSAAGFAEVNRRRMQPRRNGVDISELNRLYKDQP